MRYILIEIDDTLEDYDTLMPIEHIACSLADHLSDDLGLIAQVIHPIPTKIMEAIEEHV